MGDGDVTRLDDLLEPLHQGVWEVAVPKELVTEPPGPSWKRSALNVPSPGTIASFRKGRFHAHETTTEWRVHLDRYDPEVHPLLHLVDDAPLLLMISDTFMTLVMNTRRSEITATANIPKAQRFIWQEQVLSGFLLGLVGLDIVADPFLFFRNIFEIFIPSALILLAALVIVRAVRTEELAHYRARELCRGGAIFCAGIVTFLLPLALWIVFVLAILALWMIASAVMLLRRVICGRLAVPEGFYSRMAVGLLSLVSAVLVFVNPAGIVGLLVEALGMITVLLGIMLCANGLRLRAAMRGDSAA